MKNKICNAESPGCTNIKCSTVSVAAAAATAAVDAKAVDTLSIASQRVLVVRTDHKMQPVLVQFTISTLIMCACECECVCEYTCLSASCCKLIS